jgi:hypothetical protein
VNAADAVELGELLQFLDDWLAADYEAAGTLLVASPLRSDLARFMFLLGASYGEELFSCPGAPGPASLKGMQAPVFEETRPADYLIRAAAPDLGKAYKGIAAAEMPVRPGWLDHLATQPFFASVTLFITAATAA